MCYIPGHTVETVCAVNVNAWNYNHLICLIFHCFHLINIVNTLIRVRANSSAILLNKRSKWKINCYYAWDPSKARLWSIRGSIIFRIGWKVTVIIPRFSLWTPLCRLWNTKATVSWKRWKRFYCHWYCLTPFHWNKIHWAD